MARDDKRTLTPRLRFPEFRKGKGWEESSLGAEATFYKGRGVSKAEIDPQGQHPCIRYGELYTRYGEVIDVVFSRTNSPESALFLSRKNDVIIPASGETKEDIAKASCVMLDAVALGSDLNIIRSRHNGVFLSYLLNGAKKREIATVAQGDTVVHLYPSQLEQISIVVPPNAAEQQKIADCLTSLDELIAAQGRKVDTLKDYKKGLMQQLFPREGETIPRLRFPEFRDGGRWKNSKVADLLAVRQERRSPSDNLPLFSLTIEDGVTAKTDRYNREFLVKDTKTKLYKVVCPGDIVYNPSNLRWGAISQSRLMHAVVVSPIYEVLYLAKRDTADERFISAALMRPAQIKQFISKGQGTLVERIGVKIEFFLDTAFPIPESVKEQQKIANCLFAVDSRIAAETEKLTALHTHKKGLMQQLFPSPQED